MHAGASFVAKVETAKLMKPSDRAFDHPSRSAEAASVRGAAFREGGLNALAVQRLAVRLRIVAAVALHQGRFSSRTAGAAAQRRNARHQGQELRHVVSIGGRQDGGQRNAPCLGENVMFRPRLTAIGWVRSSFFPPRSARTEALSTMVRARSSSPRWRNSVRRAAWSRRHTPARCHRTSRRQHVLPEPQPISFGSICHGIPLRNTNKIPVNAARSATRGRPMFLNRRWGGFGNNGSIRRHKASSIRRLDMRDRLTLGHATVPSLRKQYKWHVSYF